MMKVAFLFAVIVAVALAQTAAPLKCYNLQCVDNGASCKASDTLVSFCKSGSFCNADDSCQANIGLNGDCSKNFGGCDDGLTCNGTLCIVANRMSGDTCISSSVCKAYNDTTGMMMDGSCVNGRCSGIAGGANCAVNGLPGCVFGFRCSNNGNTTLGAQSTCVAINAVGATCTSSADCFDSRATTQLFCASTPGTCQEYFSQASGNKCTGTSQCQVGLVCGRDGTCQAVGSSSNKACTAQSDCANNEACACKSASSTSTLQCEALEAYSKGRADAWKAAVSCAYADYNCQTFYQSGSPTFGTSCSGNCYKSICSTFFGGSDDSGLDASSCVPSSLKSNFDKCRKNSASVFFVAPAVAIVAIFALLF